MYIFCYYLYNLYFCNVVSPTHHKGSGKKQKSK